MSKRPIRRTIETVDPMFNIPEGVDELVYDEDLSISAQDAEGVQEQFGIVIEDEFVIELPPENPEEEEDVSGRPRAPQVLGIIKQTLRKIRGGEERVDVVLRVEGIRGVDRYEFRISKK